MLPPHLVARALPSLLSWIALLSSLLTALLYGGERSALLRYSMLLALPSGADLGTRVVHRCR